MKKAFAVLCVLALLVGAVPAVVAETAVDAYTSASTSKTVLSGADLDAAVEALVANSADLATLAESQADGYVAPESPFAQIMSVNPDGSIGLSTISQWKYIKGDGAADQVHVQLTYGQNALNLGTVGNAGSLLVKVGDVYYIVHLSVAEVTEKVYSDDAFNAGEFNANYSGQEAQLSQFDIIFDVTAVETTGSLMF